MFVFSYVFHVIFRGYSPKKFILENYHHTYTVAEMKNAEKKLG